MVEKMDCKKVMAGKILGHLSGQDWLLPGKLVRPFLEPRDEFWAREQVKMPAWKEPLRD
ncbi:hypothetical protein [Massilia sp. CCM 8734]|uniref:hypothetical protein n=1 Tax=Massilia sp. CCM 8734 TaxID=2609283 RepID=UPI00142121D5|nr:hypothetical protein [Massilia sp. CCM 8734]